MTEQASPSMLEAADAIATSSNPSAFYEPIPDDAHHFLKAMHQRKLLHPLYGVVSTDPHKGKAEDTTCDNYHLFTAVAAHLIIMWQGPMRRDRSSMLAGDWLVKRHHDWFKDCLGLKYGTIALPHRWPEAIRPDAEQHLTSHDEYIGMLAMVGTVDAIRLYNAAKQESGFMNNVEPRKHEWKTFMPRILIFWPFMCLAALKKVNLFYQLIWAIQVILTSFDSPEQTSGRQLILLQLMSMRLKEVSSNKKVGILFRLVGNWFLDRCKKTYQNHSLGPIISKYWEKPENNYCHPVSDLSWGVPIKNIYLGNLTQ